MFKVFITPSSLTYMKGDILPWVQDKRVDWTSKEETYLQVHFTFGKCLWALQSGHLGNSEAGASSVIKVPSLIILTINP